jgi:hypothetical protein
MPRPTSIAARSVAPVKSSAIHPSSGMAAVSLAKIAVYQADRHRCAIPICLKPL